MSTSAKSRKGKQKQKQNQKQKQSHNEKSNTGGRAKVHISRSILVKPEWLPSNAPSTSESLCEERLVAIATRHALPNDTRDQLVAELLDSQNQSFEYETDDASLRAKLYKVAESLSQWGFVCETSVVDDKKVAKSGSNVVKRVTIVHRGESENENQKQDLLQVVFSKGIRNFFAV